MPFSGKKHGIEILRDPRLNRGTAFTHAQRDQLGISGLLPDVESNPITQVHRAEIHIEALTTDLDKYVYFSDLQERNESLYYRVLMHDPGRYMPIVYTPTVGTACQEYGRWYRRPKGLWISRHYRGKIAQVLRNWPEPDVRFIVVTDGERILGLGDLGAQGMGIPIGKLALYTACAGVPPQYALPVMLDVGTNNDQLLNDEFYIGVRERRLTGDDYNGMIDEFVSAVQEVFPRACIQWEDFANQNAVPILERYRQRICSFNDDIQGTAAVGVAGLLSAFRLKGELAGSQRVLFFGSGSAGIGIANLFSMVLLQEGVRPAVAIECCWMFDSKGLVTNRRSNLSDQKQPFAHDMETTESLAEAVRMVKPTAIIGTSTIPGAFSTEVIEAMSHINDRPIIFPFSNPTSKAECTAEAAYSVSNGRAIFASGSPFDPVTIGGETFFPSQGNNVYIFPAMGLAVMAAQPSTLPDEAFAVAARALAHLVTADDVNKGLLFPPLSQIRETEINVATAVSNWLWDNVPTSVSKPTDVAGFVRGLAWQPQY